jgi:predicted alpha/beta hydrolase family esterase
VCPFVRDIGADTVHEFMGRDLDWDKIKSRTDHFIVIHSKDDLVVPFAEGKYVARKLSAKFVLVNNFNHFSEVDNIKTVPFMYDICEKIIFEI